MGEQYNWRVNTVIIKANDPSCRTINVQVELILLESIIFMLESKCCISISFK